MGEMDESGYPIAICGNDEIVANASHLRAEGSRHLFYVLRNFFIAGKSA